MVDRLTLYDALRTAHLELGQALLASAPGSNTPLPSEVVLRRLRIVQQKVEAAQRMLEGQDMVAGLIGP